MDKWITVAIYDGEIAFTGLGPTPEAATAELERGLRLGWTSLFKYEQDGSPYYGEYEWFKGEYDIYDPVPASESKWMET